MRDKQMAHPKEREWTPDDYVLGNEIGERVPDIQTAWQGACQRAEIRNLHFHDLRHEAGSRKLEVGWPLGGAPRAACVLTVRGPNQIPQRASNATSYRRHYGATALSRNDRGPNPTRPVRN